MVTKSRAVKHKNQESQGRLGTQNHTNYLTKCLKLTSIKKFSEDVSILTFSRDILKRHNLSFNKIPNEVISNLYVLSLRVLNRVFRDINSTRIITINNHGILWYPITFKSFFIQKSYEQQLPIAIYSAFAVNKDTEFCFLLIQATRLAPI